MVKVFKEPVKAGGVYFNIADGTRHFARVWCPRAHMESQRNQFKISMTSLPITLRQLKDVYEVAAKLSYSYEPKEE